ncbi:MAG: Ig-like domain-containing protein [Thiolinea sp.]
MSISGGVEKFFMDSPHSIGANVEISKESGGYVGDSHDTDISGNVSYRYDFGSAGLFASDEQYRRVRVEIPGKTETVQVKKPRPPKVERKLVKHTMELEADTFFKVGDHHLTPEAQQRLRSMIARIRETGHHGTIRITGNTCDIGSDQANQSLSERRAAQVRSFMVANGFNANELMARGLGESQPKYPNTDATRHKNRRVDIEYVAYQNDYKDEVIEQGYDVEEQVRVISEPRVVWRKELIPSPPTWVGQALRNNIQYKQTIDTYRTLGSDAVVEGGDNVAPVAAADETVVTSGESVTIDVLANDTDADGDVLTIQSVDETSQNGGSVQLQDGMLIYTPAAGFTGVDSFNYIITDGQGHTAQGTVTVTVNAAGSGDNLQAIDDSVSTPVNTQVMIDVVANDIDVDNDPISILGYAESSVEGGTVTTQDGKLFYTPPQDFTGTDSFVYTITDSNGHTDSATVTITVGDVVGGGTPTAVDDHATTPVDTAISIDVLANDSDPEGDLLTIQDYDDTSVNGGSISLADGLLTYTPVSGLQRALFFTYTITDGNGNTATATVTVTVENGGSGTGLAAADDSYTVAPTDLDDKGEVSLGVLGNDTYSESVSIVIVSTQVWAVSECGWLRDGCRQFCQLSAGQ